MNNKIALVTGANKGIGLAVVKRLLEKTDYTVIMTARNEERGLQVYEPLETVYSNRILFIQLDITDSNSLEKCSTIFTKKFGKVDILINNAAINYDTWYQAQNADLNEVEKTMQTNLYGAWRMIQAVLPMMKKNKYGRIVNVSSESGSLASMRGGTPGYGISKAALNALTIKLADELKNTGILVNAVCPGWVKTDMGGPNAPRSVEEGAKSVLLAALLPDDGPSGGFFRDGKRMRF